MQTSRARIEDMDFQPRLPLLRLTVLLLVFCFLSFGFITDTITQLEYRSITDPGLLAETVFVSLILLTFLGFMLSYLLLQFRLSFTEEGIRRRTLLNPRFIRWEDVKQARISSFRSSSREYFALELKVGRWRWVNVPLLSYGRSANLFAEIRKRLPVEVAVSDRDLAMLEGD